MVNQKAQTINYGSYEKKSIGSEKKLGGRMSRALELLYEEFVLTLMSLDRFKRILQIDLMVLKLLYLLCLTLGFGL